MSSSKPPPFLRWMSVIFHSCKTSANIIIECPWFSNIWPYPSTVFLNWFRLFCQLCFFPQVTDDILFWDWSRSRWGTLSLWLMLGDLGFIVFHCHPLYTNGGENCKRAVCLQRGVCLELVWFMLSRESLSNILIHPVHPAAAESSHCFVCSSFESSGGAWQSEHNGDL